MTLDIALLLGVLVYTVVAFVREWMPIDLVSLSCLGLLLLFGLVTPAEAIAGFSNPAVVTVMMMFILSDSLVKSGLIRRLGYRIAERAGKSPFKATTGLLGITGVLSAFINNVAAVSIFMPVALHLSKLYRFSPSKILLPLSYVSIFGGTCTLIGTSTNLLVSALADDYGYEPFAVFEFALLGSLLFAIGMIYNLFWGAPRLPSRGEPESLTSKYRLGSFLTEVRVPAESKLVGQTVFAEQISERFQLNVLEILRGRRRIATDIRATPLEPDDQLIVRGEMENIVAFKEQFGLLLLSDIKLSDADLADENNILAEVQISPTSRLAGQSLKELDFRKTFGCFVLAINRTGGVIRDKIAFTRLRQWDTLLVFGPRARVEALYRQDDFIPLQELSLRLRLARRWWLGAIIVPAVVVLAASGMMSILKASILGAVAVLMTGALTVQEAYKSINWTVIFLVVGILPLGTALERTGLAEMIAGAFLRLAPVAGPLLVLALIYFVTSFLTELISNNSTVVLMVPIAVAVAEGLDLSARPFLFAVAFAGSASFLTPMGYKTNAMVYGPGGYRFMDYIRAGMPLKIVFWLVATALIPVIWEF